MNAQQLQWLAEAVEVETEVEWAEQFTVWTVADEAGLEGLVSAIGWEAWERLQDASADWWAQQTEAANRWYAGAAKVAAFAAGIVSEDIADSVRERM